MPALFRLLVTLAIVAGLFGPAHAENGGARGKSPASLAGLAAVSDYTPVLEACSGPDGRRGFAIRTMTLSDEAFALIADPDALTTRLEKAASWSCRPLGEDELAATRMGRAIAASAAAPGIEHRGFLENAGLIRGARPGAFVTGDLCPSRRPLDRRFFAELETSGLHAPVALSISGLWLAHHDADFRWLTALRDAGALDIVWVNHTYTHPYRKTLPDASNYLLTPHVDPAREILDTERLLIANGETPSLFFRFPGLVSSDPLMQTVRRFHLITLGAEAWLALGEKPKAGSIVLVHPNGNEPAGLKLFATDFSRGGIARPLEPLTDAPQ